MPSLVDDAITLIEREEMVAQGISERLAEEKQEKVSQIRARIHEYLLHLPVFSEMVIHWYSIDPDLSINDTIETIMSFHEDIDFFKEDIGEKGHEELMQQSDYVDHGGDNYYFEYYAWAVRFCNIYGLDFYLIPHRDPQKGFSCATYDKLENKKYVFNGDIYRDQAVNWIARHLKTTTKKTR